MIKMPRTWNQEKGEIVRIRSNKWNPDIVIKNVHMNPTSYIVESEDGGIYRRNRKHLLKTGRIVIFFIYTYYR